MTDSLRDAQKAHTQDRIRRAVLDLLEEESPASLSVPKVASRAGVSLRTVYRYHPTKADLLQSVSVQEGERVAAQVGSRPTDQGGDLRGYLRTMWGSWTDDIGAIRLEHATPLGREMRAIRLADVRARMTETSHAMTPDLDDTHRAAAVDLVIAVTSSSMFLELVDRMGHEPDDAAELVINLVRFITEQPELATRGITS